LTTQTYSGAELKALKRLIHQNMYHEKVRTDEYQFMEAMYRKAFGKAMTISHKQDYKLLSILVRCTGTGAAFRF